MFKVGDFVLFGRPNGEQTFGRIVKVNPASYLTYGLEERAHNRRGVLYRVRKHHVSKVPMPDITDWRGCWRETI